MKRVILCAFSFVLVCSLVVPGYASSGDAVPTGEQQSLLVDERAYPEGFGGILDGIDQSFLVDAGGSSSDAVEPLVPFGEYVVLPGALLTYDELQSLLNPSDEPSGYLSYDDFISYNGDDYSVSVVSVQTTPNSPVTPDGKGLKSILLSLFGDYSPVITQLRYQANNNSTYTYVNDIQLDVPWIASAVVFTVVLYCIFKLGGTLFCKV